MSSIHRRRCRDEDQCRLTRLPSRPNNEAATDGMSCPNSPAVKKTFRLVVVGSARTGKSSLVGRFLEKDFEDRYLPTIENFYRKMYKIKGEVYQLDIVDCSGNDPFPAARKLSYISGDMFLLVASVDIAESVKSMLEIHQQIEDCKAARGATTAHETPCIFILNKIDLPEHRWQVQSDVKEIAQMIEEAVGTSDNFMTCSAATNQNIEKAFGQLFSLNKCPKHMNPELHKMLRNELSADGDVHKRKDLLKRMRSRFSKEVDDSTFSYTDPTARRPSLRTDLLMNRAKTSVHQHVSPARKARSREHSADRDSRCSIQ